MTISKSVDRFLKGSPDGDNLRAVIEKNGFNVGRSDGKTFELVDPTMPKDTPVLYDSDLSELLDRAIALRSLPKPDPASEPVKEAEAVKPDDKPEAEVSGDIELDDTGKRESKPKAEKPPKAPKQNRYERTAAILLGNLSMTPHDLAVAAGLTSDAAGQYCIESFVGTVNAFLKAGIIAKNKTSLVTYVKPSKKGSTPAVTTASEPAEAPVPLAAEGASGK